MQDEAGNKLYDRGGNLMKYYSLFFEARGIQSYIFDSGKMKEMVGASELVKMLCDQCLEEVISHLELQEIKPKQKSDSDLLESMEAHHIFFSRRSGGVFTALFADKSIRDRFLEVWTLRVVTKVPGLETVCAISEDENIQKLIESTYDELGYNRNFPPPILPEATPMHVLAPRTGKPAVQNEFTADGSRVWTDAASLQKLQNANATALKDSFLSESNKGFLFPSNLDFEQDGECEFPFRKDSRYLGLIHADGNGLGQTLLRIRENYENGAEYAVMLRLFSDRLEKSTKEAAQVATSKLIEKYNATSCMLPMRPLVLGGDDLTVLVRADYAMQFTEDYCNAFEKTTEENFKELNEISKGIIPKKLTACAGLAYIKNNQPFMDAFELAESLCAESKRISKKLGRDIIPATVTSLVVTNSFIESYEDYKEKELTIKKGQKTYIATLGAYAFDENEKEIPTLKALRLLCKALEKQGEQDGARASFVRQYATMIFGDETISEEKWRRWMEILEKRNSFTELSQSLQSFGVKKVRKSPWRDDLNTPIFDALQLMNMEGEMNV